VSGANRREFLSALLAASALRAERKNFVPSDIAPLRRVLVHTPGPEIHKGLGLSGEPAFLSGGAVGEDAIEEHRGFVRLLKESGAEVLEVEAVLDHAIDRARSGGKFHAWVEETVPHLLAREDQITGAALIGAADDFAYARDAQDQFHPLTDSLRSIVYTRDSAVITPRGAIVCNFSLAARKLEAELIRFVFAQAPEFESYPVIFDAIDEQVHIEGGDAMVLDQATLLLGVGNRTAPEAAPLLARRLQMNVVAIQMPPRPRTPLHPVLLHLDTIFTLAGARTALTVPFLLEARYAGSDPLSSLLKDLARLPEANAADFTRMAAVLKELGRVTVYRAGSGERDPAAEGMKLGDWIRDRGFQLVYVGGSVPAAPDPKYVAESVIRELRFQAANVLATAPGRLLAYAGNERTLQAMRAAGLGVSAFRGGELMRTNGGPHCMSMPLERG